MIAEIGLNHNGDFDLARRMADSARASGADAAKFQIYDADAFLHSAARLGDGAPGSLREFFRGFQLSAAHWRALAEHVRSLGMEFFASVFDEPSLQLYRELQCKLIKIASADLNNFMLFERLLEGPWQILLATGASNEDEVYDALEEIPAERQLLLMECVSQYPARPESYNLSALQRWSHFCATGLSDHSEDNSLAAAATALGARAIEKHFTLDRNLAGPDQSISQDPKMFAAMARSVRAIHQAMLQRPKRALPDEEGVRRYGRRGLYARRDVNSDDVFDRQTAIDLRPAEGAWSAHSWPQFSGASVARSQKAGEALEP